MCDDFGISQIADDDLHAWIFISPLRPSPDEHAHRATFGDQPAKHRAAEKASGAGHERVDWLERSQAPREDVLSFGVRTARNRFHQLDYAKALFRGNDRAAPFRHCASEIDGACVDAGRRPQPAGREADDAAADRECASQRAEYRVHDHADELGTGKYAVHRESLQEAVDIQAAAGALYEQPALHGPRDP